MKKYIFVTALLIGNTAWAMKPEQQTAKVTNTTINTSDLKKIIPTTPLQEGWAILDNVNQYSGIIPTKPHENNKIKLSDVTKKPPLKNTNIFNVHKTSTGSGQQAKSTLTSKL
jgi:hypothetical protein